MTASARTRPRSAITASIAAVAVVAASFAIGGLTSFGQTFLPDGVRSVANSASGWTFLTALLVWAARRSYLWSAGLGAASFVALVYGFVVVTQWRGFPANPFFWSVVGVVAGPFIGIAAAAQWDAGPRRALGAGLLAGIAIGEGIYGLTVVLATTSWVYWTLSILIGLGITAVAAIKLADVRLVVLELVTATVVAASFWLAYQALAQLR